MKPSQSARSLAAHLVFEVKESMPNIYVHNAFPKAFTARTWCDIPQFELWCVSARAMLTEERDHCSPWISTDFTTLSWFLCFVAQSLAAGIGCKERAAILVLLPTVSHPVAIGARINDLGKTSSKSILKERPQSELGGFSCDDLHGAGAQARP